MRLIADIGGTNSRLALSLSGEISSGTIRSYANKNWDSFYAIISDFLLKESAQQLTEIVLAVAGPVHGNRAKLTNLDWRVDTIQLAEICADVPACLLNDLTALGYSVPALHADQLKLVSAGLTNQSTISQSMVVGIGTGFNISPVLETANAVICPAVEAGHISMPLAVVQNLQRLGFDQADFPTVEALFSGRGFVDFCQKLAGGAAMTGPALIEAYDMSQQAEVTQAIDAYSGLLGHLLRSLSLAYMPSAGVYLAGSVARSVMTKAPQPCVEVFREPAAIVTCNNAPIWMVNDDLAALSGCANFAFLG